MNCNCITNCFSSCLTCSKKHWTDFWTTDDTRFREGVTTSHQREKLNRFNIAIRLSSVAFLAIEITGFVLLAVAFKSPPPYHMLTGLYVCLGGLVFLPIALAIIGQQRKEYCEKQHIAADQIYTSPPTSDESEVE